MMMHIIPEDDEPVLRAESDHEAEEDDHETELLDIARDEQLDRHTSAFEQELCDTYRCSDYFAQFLSNSHPQDENSNVTLQQPDPSWRVNICEWLDQVLKIKGENLICIYSVRTLLLLRLRILLRIRGIPFTR